MALNFSFLVRFRLQVCWESNWPLGWCLARYAVRCAAAPAQAKPLPPILQSDSPRTIGRPLPSGGSHENVRSICLGYRFLSRVANWLYVESDIPTLTAVVP